MLLRILTGCAVLAAAGTIARAQDLAPVDYRVSFENAVHHEARITLSLRDIGEAPLVLRMSRSSPGRYALHEFAKNVYDVEAEDGAGRPLKVLRRDPYSWRVEGHDGTARVSYTLYADRADGTYSQIDLTHAHLNMPATFMWAEGFEDRAITIAFEPPDRRWKAATQLTPTRRAMTFTAPDLQYFMDSPTELSASELREWRVGDGDARQTIRLAVHHDGEDEDVDILAEKARKVVAEQMRIFGEAPTFDHGVYTFIADYLPYASGDGMEHRNSTILTNDDGLYEEDFAQLGTVSHEFFHAWNVERLRPVELEPFNFSRANPTPSLWFAEGFTSYYGPLAIRRAGENSLKEYLKDLSKTLSGVVNAPGRQDASPQAMSLSAAFVDAATSIDPVNTANTFVSYYPYGAVVALALDLTIRQRFENLTLDDYMRHLWREYGKPETPYTHEDLRQGLADVTGDAAFAEDFFARYIEAGDLPDFEPLLSQAGLALSPKNEDAASAGEVSFEENGDALIVASNTIEESPLYKAGLERGDDIKKLGRFKIDSEKDWEKALKRFEPGDETTIEFAGRSGERRASITLIEDKTLAIKPYEDMDRELTDAQKAFREAWLGPDSDSEEGE